MKEGRRVAIVAASAERRRALASLAEAEGHRVVEDTAEIVLVDVGGDDTAIESALRSAAASLATPSNGSGPRGFGPAADTPASPLTPRELEILDALGDGLSNKEVARALGISAHTVKFHLETIFRKLDAASRAEAVAKGMRQGIIEL